MIDEEAITRLKFRLLNRAIETEQGKFVKMSAREEIIEKSGLWSWLAKSLC